MDTLGKFGDASASIGDVIGAWLVAGIVAALLVILPWNAFDSTEGGMPPGVRDAANHSAGRIVPPEYDDDFFDARAQRMLQIVPHIEYIEPATSAGSPSLNGEMC